MNYLRLHITTEGKSEEAFVKSVLGNYLGEHKIGAYSRSVLTGRNSKSGYEHRGGILNYNQVKRELNLWMKEDNNPEVFHSSMIDLYALPSDFPGNDKAQQINDPYQKVEYLEKAFQEDIGGDRFIPYIQLHEFEALIFANPDKLKSQYLDREKEIEELISLVNEKGNPEFINDGKETAPSKRILKVIPVYHKVDSAKIITQEIGMKAMMEQCRHFREWIDRILKHAEQLRS